MNMYQHKKGSLLPSLAKKMGRYAALSSFAACFLAAPLFTSCQDDYDDTALWDTVNDLEQRLAALEEWQNEVNHNIQSLYELINTTDYITSVTPYLEGGKEVGYTITFLHSDPIVIYHGEKGDKGEDGQAGQDGQDGYTPQIGLTQEADGNWYWTLDGELMLDPQGNPIRANGLDGQDGEDGQDGKPGSDGKPGADGKPGQDGEDGQDGQDGQPGAPAPVPQISLGSKLAGGTYYGLDGREQSRPDSTAWYLSVDEGKTWYRISGEDGDDGNRGPQGPTGPVGPKGDSFFKDVTDKGDYVEFTLSDGTTFTVQKYQNSLTFSLGGTVLTDLTQAIDLADGALTYSPATAEVSARILEGEGWSANAENGTIATTGIIGSEALLEVTLMDNGRVIETYRLTLAQNNFIGEGTVDSPYTLSSIPELVYLAEQVNQGEDYEGAYFKLTDDVDLNGVEWTPIGYTQSGAIALGKPFRGTFDGNNKTISNLSINTTDTKLMVGFIGHNRGTVKDLAIENATIEGGSNAGAFVGQNQGLLENCHVSGTTSISSSGDAGALVGSNNLEDDGIAEIRECSVTGTVEISITGNNTRAGGLVGYNYGGTITASTFSGKLDNKSTVQNLTIGGIAGYTGSNKSNVVNGGIIACYAACELSGSCLYAGGIAGQNSAGRVVACYSVIKGFPNQNGGGIIGRNVYGNREIITACYWEKKSGVSKPLYGSGTTPDSYNANTINVDGTTTTWETAKDAMNTALSDTGWQYEDNTDPETKGDFPLIIVPQGN